MNPSIFIEADTLRDICDTAIMVIHEKRENLRAKIVEVYVLAWNSRWWNRFRKKVYTFSEVMSILRAEEEKFGQPLHYDSPFSSAEWTGYRNGQMINDLRGLCVPGKMVNVDSNTMAALNMYVDVGSFFVKGVYR